MRSLERAEDVVEVRRRVETVTHEDRALWGEMNVCEMVCHVREAFRLATGERAAAPVKVGVPGPVVKVLALWFPRPWPHGVATVPELRRGGSGLVAEDFAADRHGLLDAFDRFVAGRENRNRHPIFGRMSPRDWMRWGFLHTDHHLRQFGR